ncbi:MAG: HisA/HisF-related TIM barrel protein [Thermoleophilaceae bacterium]
MPHIGWTPVSWRRRAGLIEGLGDPTAFYHVHSFAPRPANREDLLGTAELRRHLRLGGRARQRLRGAVPPREVGARRPGAASQLRRPGRAGRRGMILLPAVDIRDGRAVRLRQGRFDDETVYADDPLEAARSFVQAGARYLHVVDLDGARDGEPANLHHLERIANELGTPVQYGGGLRSLAAIRSALAAGAERVVVGTAAYTDAAFLEEALATWAHRVVVGVDVRGGRVAVSGWTRETQMLPEQLIERLQDQGASRFVYTNADRDGMLEGVDVDEVMRISEAVRGRLIWSGGVGSIDDHARAARPAPGQPDRRDLGQGAVRGPLHRGRRPSRAGRPALLTWP